MNDYWPLLVVTYGHLTNLCKLSMSLDRPMLKRARTAAARGAADAGSTAVTALDLDDLNDVTGADREDFNRDDDGRR